VSWIVYAFVIGLCFGSFANVLAYRLPRKVSILMPPSGCIACKASIAYYDLLPVLSWIILKGRCRFCKVCISIRYPLMELICGLLFAGMVILTPTFSAVFLSLFAFMMLVVALIDHDTLEISDSLLVFTALLGVTWVVLSHFSLLFPMAPDFIGAGLGILAGGIPLFAIDRLVMILYKKDGFGYGDVKLMAVCGLFLGWQLIFVAYVIAFIVGGMYASFLLISGRAKRGQYIAFGPFLVAGVIISLWVGKAFIDFLL